MHSRKRGKHGSKKPLRKSVPAWVPYKQEDVELLIAKLAKDGKGSAYIGTALRDTYGIPDVRTLTSKKISQILKEKNITSELPDDLSALIRKSVKLRKHITSNKGDQTSKRGLILTESKIKRLVKYYKRTGKLRHDWKMAIARIGLYA